MDLKARRPPSKLRKAPHPLLTALHPFLMNPGADQISVEEGVHREDRIAAFLRVGEDPVPDPLPLRRPFQAAHQSPLRAEDAETVRHQTQLIGKIIIAVPIVEGNI